MEKVAKALREQAYFPTPHFTTPAPGPLIREMRAGTGDLDKRPKVSRCKQLGIGRTLPGSVSSMTTGLMPPTCAGGKRTQ